jgi:hypothetical protein
MLPGMPLVFPCQGVGILPGIPGLFGDGSGANLKGERNIAEKEVFKGLFGLVIYFDAPMVKNLDPVLFNRIVGRGDHSATSEEPLAGNQVGNRGGRQNSTVHHPNTCAGQALHKCGFEPIAGLPGICADQKGWR